MFFAVSTWCEWYENYLLKRSIALWYFSLHQVDFFLLFLFLSIWQVVIFTDRTFHRLEHSLSIFFSSIYLSLTLLSCFYGCVSLLFSYLPKIYDLIVLIISFTSSILQDVPSQWFHSHVSSSRHFPKQTHHIIPH